MLLIDSCHSAVFADAHVLVLTSPRFDCTFWKYRHHAKGYCVVALEAGNLSQTLCLSATEAGWAPSSPARSTKCSWSRPSASTQSSKARWRSAASAGAAR